MNEEPEYMQHAMQKSPGCSVQSYFNMVLEILAAGDKHTSADLLRLMKRNWRLVSVEQFSDIYQYVVTLPVIMDEVLKLFSAFPLRGEHFQEQVEEVLMTGCKLYERRKAEAWIFCHGTKEYKEQLLIQSVQILDHKYPECSWSLTAVDPLLGERFYRKKYIERN